MRMKELHKHRLTLQLISAIMLIMVGVGLLVAGFILPPVGEIHNSVLVAFGEILTFAGTLFGIDYHYKSRGSIMEERNREEVGEK